MSNPYDPEPPTSPIREAIKGVLMAVGVIAVPVALLYGISRVSGDASTAELILTIVTGAAFVVLFPLLVYVLAWWRAMRASREGETPTGWMVAGVGVGIVFEIIIQLV